MVSESCFKMTVTGREKDGDESRWDTFYPALYFAEDGRWMNGVRLTQPNVSIQQIKKCIW